MMYLESRIGSPNEHLAGGHSEDMNDPRYSTSIGLILRGYHNFENGTYKNSGNNLPHISLEDSTEEMVEKEDVKLGKYLTV
ncbi:MAG: hypothetical protein WC716_05450 [Chitinophagaceae bacterium]|jgi:cell division protein FtsA